MRGPWILGAAVALAVQAHVALADEGVRLVEVLPAQTLSRTHPQVTFAAPALAPGARYFFSVERDGTQGRVALNGQVVVRPGDLARPGGEVVRVEVPLLATNVLQVKVGGRAGLRVAVHGVVPASALPAGVGRRAALVTLYERSFAGRIPPRLHATDVTVPTTDGLFTLAIEQAGQAPAITATLLWNARPVLGVLPILPGRDADQGPVLVRDDNALEVVVLGVPSSSVRVALSGYVVDETPPTVAWDPVPDELEPSTPLRATYADAISGIPQSQVKILLDGGQDVTAAFDVGASEATSTVARLEALAPSTARGVHTLTAVVTDRGGLSAQSAIALVRDAPPVISTPGDLLIEQTAPEGAAVSFVVTVTDDLDDPPPPVDCVPSSGSTFPAGTTTVTCTARDSGDNVATATFLVTVRDTTPPALLLPPDLVVEQTSPSGAVATFSVSASDAVDPAPLVECTPASGSLFAAGTTTVTCTARDAAGNASSATFRVTVQDTQPPTATLSPSEGSVVTVDRVPVRLTFADSGSGVDPSTIAITIDGAPLELTLADGEATATTPPLAEGMHELGATLGDRAGNPTTVSSTFEVALPDLVAADRLDLPAARAGGGYSTATLLVSNASDRVPLHLRGVTTAGDFALDTPLPFGGAMLLPGGALELRVRFAPSALGPVTGSLALESNDPREPVHVVSLAGEGTRGALELTLDPGPSNALPVGSLHRLRLRAVGFDGATDASFTGFVEVSTTDPRSPLNGLVVELGDAEQGLLEVPPLVAFLTPGPHTLTASLLELDATTPIGALAVVVTPPARGAAYLLVTPPAPAAGDLVHARVLVDLGPDDGDPSALGDTLGGYDLRLLFSEAALEVVRVLPGTSRLGAPLFVQRGSLRLQDLNVGDPHGGAACDEPGCRCRALSGAPDPTATGPQELFTVELRVRPDAPSGDTALALVVDALASAEPGLRPLGEPGPRLATTLGVVQVATPNPPAPRPAVIGVAPRRGDDLRAPVQAAGDVVALLSRPAAPFPGAVRLIGPLGPVPGTVRATSESPGLAFRPDAPLAPGHYSVEVDPAVGDSASGTGFDVEQAPDEPPAGDLDQDGEVSALDLMLWRDLVLGRVEGQALDFPPVFVEGAPGSLELREGEALSVRVVALDPEGEPVVLFGDVPGFGQLARGSGEGTFVLTLAPGEHDAGDVVIPLSAATPDGAAATAALAVSVENVNRPPTLRLVGAEHFEAEELPVEPVTLGEGGTRVLVLEVDDPDLGDPTHPDTLTFDLPGDALDNLTLTQVDPGHLELTFSPDFDQAGSYVVPVRVTDQAGEEATLAIPFEVEDNNRLPTITMTVDPPGTRFVIDDRVVTVTYAAEPDPDGDPVELVLCPTALAELEESAEDGDLTYTVSGTSVSVRLLRPGAGFGMRANYTDGHAVLGTDIFDGSVFIARTGAVLGPDTFHAGTIHLSRQTEQVDEDGDGAPDDADEDGEPDLRRFLLGDFGVSFVGSVIPLTYQVALSGSGHTLTRTSSGRYRLRLDLDVPEDLPVPYRERRTLTITAAIGTFTLPVDLVVGPVDGATPTLEVLNGWTAPRAVDRADPSVELRLRVTQPALVSALIIDGQDADVPPVADGDADLQLTVDVDIGPGATELSLYLVDAAGVARSPVTLPLVPYEELGGYGTEPGDGFALVHRVPYPDGDRHEEAQPFIVPLAEDPRTLPLDSPLVLRVAQLEPDAPGDEGEVWIRTTACELGRAEVQLDSTLSVHLRDGSTVSARASRPIVVALRTGEQTLDVVEDLGDRIVLWVPENLFDGVENQLVQVAVSFGDAGVYSPGPPQLSPENGAVVRTNRPLVELLFPVGLDEGAYALWHDTGEGTPARVLTTVAPLEVHPRDGGQPFAFRPPRAQPFPRGKNRLRLIAARDGEGGRVELQTEFEVWPCETVDGRVQAMPTCAVHAPDPTCDGAPPGETDRCHQGDCMNDDADADCACDSAVGNTVLLSTGEERLERVDLVIPGRAGMDFVLRRRYRSQLWFNGPLGFGWDHGLNEGLFVSPEGHVVRQNGGSHLDTWTRRADGTFRAPEGYFGALTQAADGTYSLRFPDGRQSLYTDEGRLVMQLDRHGNSQRFEYDERGNLVRVLDVYGRAIELVYQTFPHPLVADAETDRLVRVRDFAGREVRYSYDARGDLVAVTTPAVVGTSNGNDFPLGRTERYTYSQGFADPRLNHNLLTVTSPQEVARGAAGVPWLRLTYGTSPAQPHTFDRVLSETVGGTNASGVPAGGTRTFTYEAIADGDEPDVEGAVQRVTVTEPNGNVSRHLLDAHGDVIVLRQLTRGLREGEPAWFETRSTYDADGRLVRRVLPEGNEERLVYGRGSRADQKDLVERRLVPGPRGDGLGGSLEERVWTYTYEPLYHQVASITEPRGNATTFVPPLGENSPERYTTRFVFDYQESADPVPQADALGIDLSRIARGLGDQNGDGRTDQVNGDVVRVVAPAVLREDCTTQEVLTETRWNDVGQVSATVDAEGNVTTFDYHREDDPDGDGQGVAGVTSGGAATGHLRAVTADAGPSPRRSPTAPAPLALTTTFAYDVVGNVTRVTNPRGVTTAFEVNALNEVVSVTRGAEVGQAIFLGELPPTDEAPAFVSRSYRDHDGRVVRTEVEDRGGVTPGVGPWIERASVYDVLGRVVETRAEVDGSPAWVTTRLRYDPSGNLVEVTSPEGRRVVTTYDERDLVHTVTRGAGTPLASTVTFDHDGNGNRLRVTDAEDSDGDGAREATTFAFDGFDRPVQVTDAMGNMAFTGYDVASHVVLREAYDAAGALVSHSTLDVDELGRVYRSDALLFVEDAVAAALARPAVLSDHDGDGYVTARVEFDALSRPVAVIEDDGQITRTTYDGVSRPVAATDALGNQRITTYDRGGNPTRVSSVEVSPEGLVPAEGFTTLYVYDALDRLVRATDSAGQTTRFTYTSRDLLHQRSDPEGPLTADPLGLFPGPINGPGNTCGYLYDGLGRQVQQVCDLRVGGTGAGALDLSNPHNPDGRIALSYVFDRDSLLTGILDDKGNRTSFGFDALGRRTSQTNADLEAYVFTYDRDGNVRTVTDPSGSVVIKRYDALERLTEVTVSRGPGVLGTTRETYAYDGLSRLVRATDDNGVAGAGAERVVEYAHDSLGRVLEERQDGRAISSRYAGDGKRTQVTYPGGRTIARTFDALDRIKELQDGAATLARSDWIGPGLRELRRSNGNGTRLTFLNDAGNADVGYDAVQRLVRLRCVSASGVPFVDREYAYNRASQRTLERRHDDSGLTDRYTYDSAYRVVASAYDQDGLPGAVPRPLRSASYVLDGVGNRRQVDKATDAGTVSESYTVNVVNEYTTVAGVARTNDDNGNLTDDGSRLLFYDYKNRLVAVSDKASARPIATYEYLPDGRRAKKTTFGPSGQVTKATAFFYDGAQEVEEQDAGSGATEATYVWSPVYVDELVTYTNSQGTFCTHQDARCDVVAITNAGGSVVERIRYDDFGKAETRSASGQVLAASAVGNVHGFQGRRLDAETGLLYFRARYYDPETGRFLQRDPVWDAGNVGGQYTFCANNPGNGRDPFGTQGRIVQGEYFPDPRYGTGVWKEEGEKAFQRGGQGVPSPIERALLREKALKDELAQALWGMDSEHAEMLASVAAAEMHTNLWRAQNELLSTPRAPNEPMQAPGAQVRSAARMQAELDAVNLRIKALEDYLDRVRPRRPCPNETSSGKPQQPNERGKFENLIREDVPRPAPIGRLELRDGKWVVVNPMNPREVRTARGEMPFVKIGNSLWVPRAAYPRGDQGARPFGHIDLSAGREVDYAGMVRFGGAKNNGGQLQGWSNNSGHYKPDAAFADRAGLPMDRFSAAPID